MKHKAHDHRKIGMILQNDQNTPHMHPESQIIFTLENYFVFVQIVGKLRVIFIPNFYYLLGGFFESPFLSS